MIYLAIIFVICGIVLLVMTAKFLMVQYIRNDTFDIFVSILAVIITLVLFCCAYAVWPR
jgi:hypothetical protein